MDIPPVTQDHASDIEAHAFEGPITRNRAKKLQQEVHAFLAEINFNIYENFILPKSSTLVVISYTREEERRFVMTDLVMTAQKMRRCPGFKGYLVNASPLDLPPSNVKGSVHTYLEGLLLV